MTHSHPTIRTGLLACLLVAVVVAGGRAAPVPAQEQELNAISAVAWSTEVVDGGAEVGAYASLALDVEDRPHISYFDEVNNALKVASYDGTDWTIESLDSTYVSACQTSLALDSAGRPHISYCGLDIMGAPQLKYAYHDADGWSITPVSNEAVTYTSLALDAVGRPHIAYLASGAVRYAAHTGSDWSLDTAVPSGAGGSVSLALDGSDGPRISYHAVASGCLMHAYIGGAGWASDTVDCEGGAGWYNSLALNPTGQPRIAYFGNDRARYAWHDGTEWHSVTADSGASTGWFASLALDTDDRPHIGYYQSIPDPSGDEMLGQVKYARFDGADWLIEVVEGGGDVGKYASLALNAAGSPHLGYQDATNGNLKHAEYDLEPPEITVGPTADPVTQNSALIGWETDEESDSLVRYGQQAGSLDESMGDPGLVLNHSVGLDGLEPSTPYHYVVESTDASGNTVTSPAGFFTTAAAADVESPVISAPVLSGPEGAFGYHVLRVTASDNEGVERVVFKMDGAVLGTAYSPTQDGTYEFVVAAPHLGMAREEFYTEHQFQAVAYDYAGSSVSSTYTGIPLAPPLNGNLQILAPDPQHAVHAPGGTTPPGTTVEIEVYASEYEWDCFHLPLLLAPDGDSAVPDAPRAVTSSGSVPLSIWPPWCHEVERAVEWVEFSIDDVSQSVSYPSSNEDLVHTWTWDASGLGPGSHEVKVVAGLSDESRGQRTRTIEIVLAEPQLDVSREITRVDNVFRVRLLVENQGTAVAEVDRVVDNLTGFQAIRKTFDAIGGGDDYYTVATEYDTGTRLCDVTVGLHQNTGDPLPLDPGASVIVEYQAAPILYASPWTGQYAGGDEPVRILYDNGTGPVSLELDRPSTHSFNLTPLESEVYGARAASDYLIVSNPSRLFAAFLPFADDTNQLLSNMAELAQLKQGILGDATYAGPLIGPGQAVVGYDAAYVRFLLDTWGQGMMGSDGVPGHHLQNGYVLLVGENDIVPARDLSKSDWLVRLSDLWYGDTDHDWPNPERVVGRIIGNSASGLSLPIEASIQVQKGEPGYDFDRDQALVLAGTGDGRSMFEQNADEVSQELINEFNLVLTAYQQALQDAGQIINDWFQANVPDQDVIYYRDHSSESSWGDGATVVGVSDFGGTDPVEFGSSKPFVFACSCLSGNYDGISIAEAFLVGGAAAYIGATEVSDRFWNNEACTEFYQLWVDSPLSIGQALRDTKRDVTEGDWWSNYEGDRWAAEYNLYGDPKYGGGTILVDTAAEEHRATPPATLSVVVPDYEVATIDGADYVSLPGGNALFALGQPVVPIWAVETSIPAGYDVQDLTLTSRSGLTSGIGLNLPMATLAWDSDDAPATSAEVQAGWWPGEVFEWEVIPDPAGGSRLIVRLAPFYYNAATSEHKFYKDYEFSITYQASSVSIELLETDKVAYPLGAPVQIDLWLNNEGEAQDVLVEMVIRAVSSEEVVGGLPLRTLQGLTGLGSYMAQWDSTGFEAGDYRLEVTIRDGDGLVLDREWTEFSIGGGARVYLPCVLRQ